MSVPSAQAHGQAVQIPRAKRCDAKCAEAIVDHLMDVDVRGVDLHGITRALQYADEFRRGYLAVIVVPWNCLPECGMRPVLRPNSQAKGRDETLPGRLVPSCA